MKFFTCLGAAVAFLAAFWFISFMGWLACSGITLVISDRSFTSAGDVGMAWMLVVSVCGVIATITTVSDNT